MSPTGTVVVIHLLQCLAAEVAMDRLVLDRVLDPLAVSNERGLFGWPFVIVRLMMDVGWMYPELGAPSTRIRLQSKSHFVNGHLQYRSSISAGTFVRKTRFWNGSSDWALKLGW